MTVVFVHGIPETNEIWSPLRRVLDRDSIAVALPGFGTTRPEGFTGTKDAYAEWLADVLKGVAKSVDVVGHDLGASHDAGGLRGRCPITQLDGRRREHFSSSVRMARAGPQPTDSRGR